MERRSNRVLLTGGAGYIGRATANVLKREGFEPYGIDAYLAGSRRIMAEFLCDEADLADLKAARRAFKNASGSAPPLAVIHFAARALVGESTEQPELYFRNNFLASLNVAELVREFKIPYLLHSSSCAVYGIPSTLPIAESFPLAPISPYGATKRSSEEILSHMALRYGFRTLHLRYFNPAGALEDLSWGECHIPETHLIPNVIRCARSGERLSVFGKDLPTPDGTCIRDFIHIEDLAYAHLSALRAMNSSEAGPVECINVGAGRGTSVLEVIRACELLTQRSIDIDWRPARAGDPIALVADIRKASKLLGWRPTRTLTDILRSQLKWTDSHR